MVEPVVTDWGQIDGRLTGANCPVSYSRISEIEEKIGAGLLEEVIQVAEGELKLVDTMAEHKV